LDLLNQTLIECFKAYYRIFNPSIVLLYRVKRATHSRRT
jgi:hypothetical protein